MNLRPSHRRTLFLGLTILLLALNAACSAFPPAAQFHAADTKAPARALAGVKADLSLAPAPQVRPNVQTAESVPPVLVSAQPQDGASWAGEPVTLTFDRPLPADFAGRLSVQPPLPGRAAVEGDSLIFSAQQTPAPGTRYTFSVAAAGSAPQSITLPGAFPLSVTATQPSQGTANVAPSTQIVAIFNRPVVPLTSIDEQAKLPQPLSIEPAVAGAGQWINTSVYAFQPDNPLAGATTYTVTVDNVTAAGGETLAEPVIFSFTTAAPIVISANPMGSLVQPSAGVRVDFSQPMDFASTEAAFNLRQTWDESAPPIAGDFGWENASATLVFTPTEPLEFGQSYSINVAADALAAGGEGQLREAFSSLFTVVPFPAVAGVFPVDHATDVLPDTDVTIRFNTEVSPTLVLQNVTISPMLTSTQVYSYYSIWDNTLNLSWFKEPQTRYTVTVGAAIADPFGNTLGDELQFSFTTGDYSPYAKLELSRFTHFNAATPPRVGILFRNVDSIAVELYRLPQTELFKLTGSNEWEAWQNYAVPNTDANRIWRREYDTSDNLNITVRQIVTVTDAAGDVLPPGAYFMSVTSPQIKTVEDATSRDNPSQAAFFLSNANLLIKKSEQGASLAWLTDLNSGAPIADANIRFYADGDLLGESATDDSGVTLTRLALPQEKMWTPVIALSGEPGQPDYAIVSSNWSDGIAPWEFNINGGWGATAIQAYFYTERPIYRPGHTVYWKGIVRTLVDDDYQLPPPNTVISVTIRDDMGNPIHEEVQTLGPHGTVNGELQLSPEARTGYYYLDARLAQGDQNIPLSGQGFEVVAYRTPEFEISVDALQDEYIQGDTVQVRAKAAYFSGGPLANAPVTWRLISDPYYFNWSGEDGNHYYSFMPFDPDQEEYDPYSGSFSLGLVQEGEGVTDANGEFLIELPADIGRSRQSQSWTFDVTVQSPSNQFVSGSVAVPIHRAAYYVGLSPWAYLSRGRTCTDRCRVDHAAARTVCRRGYRRRRL